VSSAASAPKVRSRARDCRSAPRRRSAPANPTLLVVHGTRVNSACCSPDRQDDPAVFWAPRLSLGTGGGRLEEVLSRKGADFRPDGSGGWLVRYPAKTTASPIRDVPVHSVLMEVSLLELIQKAGDGFLFPDLEIDRKGRRAGSFSRNFTRYRRPLKLTARGLDFHGLRTTANSAMEERGHSNTIRNAICGWRAEGMADGDYLRAGPAWPGRRRAVESIPLREWGV
jgi:integrase